MSIVTIADGTKQYEIDLQSKSLSNEELEISLSALGLLTAANAQSTGALPDFIKGLVRFGVSLVGVFFGFPGRAGPTPEGRTQANGKTLEEKYKEDHETRAARRKKVRDAIHGIEEKLTTLATEVSEQQDEQKRQGTLDHIEDLESALGLLREQAKPMDEHFDAWRAKKEPQLETDHTLEVNWEELPLVTDLVPEDSEDGPPAGTDKEPTGSREVDLKGSKEIFDTFGIVVARSASEPRELNPGGAKDPGKPYPGIFYRPVIPLHLVFFEKDRSGSFVKTGDQTFPVFAGGNSVGFIEFGKTRWSKESASATFGENGELVTLSSVKESAAAAAARTAGELPAEVFSALETANKIIDEAQKTSLQGVEHRISQLQKRKELLEADIALGTAVDNRSRTEEVARLKSEIELLQQKKALGVARRDLDSDEVLGHLAMMKELADLRLQIEKVRLDRLSLESQIGD